MNLNAKIMKSTIKKKKVYFKKKKCHSVDANLFHYTTFKKSFKVQRYKDFLWLTDNGCFSKQGVSSLTCESMYSFEDECCHAAACLASKLEGGCRQLFYKLKSCEATQRKSAS